MQLKKIEPEAHLSIVLEFSPEVRFTPGGNRVATWRAIGMPTFQFQMWADCGGYDCGHAKCKEIDKLVDIIPCTSIDVWGKVQERKYEGTEGEVTYHTFTVNRWKGSS